MVTRYNKFIKYEAIMELHKLILSVYSSHILSAYTLKKLDTFSANKCKKRFLFSVLISSRRCKIFTDDSIYNMLSILYKHL